MGRELQKKKRRSGRHPVRRPPSAQTQKKILHNPLLRANWNKKETLSQNYRRLGLVSKLNARAGGTQRMGVDSGRAGASGGSGLEIKPGTTRQVSGGRGLKEVVLVRDEKTGEVQVVNEDDEIEENPLGDMLNEVEGEEEEAKQWVTVMGHIGKQKEGVVRTDITEALEDLARSGKVKKARHQSEREEEWLEALVEKYGKDYEGMFRDRKLNVMQQSQGDLKKRVKKYLARKSQQD